MVSAPLQPQQERVGTLNGDGAGGEHWEANGDESIEECIKVVQAGRYRLNLRLKVMGPQGRSVKVCQIDSRDRNKKIEDEIFVLFLQLLDLLKTQSLS